MINFVLAMQQILQILGRCIKMLLFKKKIGHWDSNKEKSIVDLADIRYISESQQVDVQSNCQ